MERMGLVMDEKIMQLKNWIAESDNIVFFGGAGVSTESGIPDFRSVDGLYNQKWKYPPETILSHSFFERDPEEYYRFHREKLVIDGVKPNRAHTRLAELEEEDFELVARIAKVAKKLAEEEGIAEGGYRLVSNCRADAGQEVPHLHFHLLGGRRLSDIC